MTSSVALTSKRSQNQSTAISDDAIVSNMNPWSSERLESEKSCVLFMGLQYTILTPVPILCATYPTGRAADSVSVTLLQQMRVILFNFLNKFIYTVLL